VIEWRSADGDYGRLSQLAADLVERKVDVIVADTTQATQAARRATSTIPIVMAIVADPVGSGVVANLSQPGGNITGLSIMLAELSAKRLQLLKDAVPRVTRVAVLWNPPTAYHVKALENLKAVAPSLAIELSVVSANVGGDRSSLEVFNRARAEALYVAATARLSLPIERQREPGDEGWLPVISGERPYTDEGGLGPRPEL
jgi:putative ABC transport system substrate-binding protein